MTYPNRRLSPAPRRVKACLPPAQQDRVQPHMEDTWRTPAPANEQLLWWLSPPGDERPPPTAGGLIECARSPAIPRIAPTCATCCTLCRRRTPMLRRVFASPTSRAFLTAVVLAAAPGVAAPSDNVEGVVTSVHGGYVTLRADDGHTHRFPIGNRTRVVFQSSRDEASFPNAKIDVLAEGMRIRVNPAATAGPVLDRVHVVSVPEGARV